MRFFVMQKAHQMYGTIKKKINLVSSGLEITALK
jgi:hypothetical protein